MFFTCLSCLSYQMSKWLIISEVIPNWNRPHGLIRKIWRRRKHIHSLKVFSVVILFYVSADYKAHVGLYPFPQPVLLLFHQWTDYYTVIRQTQTKAVWFHTSLWRQTGWHYILSDLVLLRKLSYQNPTCLVFQTYQERYGFYTQTFIFYLFIFYLTKLSVAHLSVYIVSDDNMTSDNGLEIRRRKQATACNFQAGLISQHLLERYLWKRQPD
jgi:hypothetical protein